MPYTLLLPLPYFVVASLLGLFLSCLMRRKRVRRGGVYIIETSERVTRNKRIKMCRVQWSHHTEDEVTWEREEELKKTYPNLFASQPIRISGRDSYKEGRFVTIRFEFLYFIINLICFI